jgi:hypothetical protein
LLGKKKFIITGPDSIMAFVKKAGAKGATGASFHKYGPNDPNAYWGIAYYPYSKNLPGYSQYRATVRWRLIPGIF